MKLIGKVPIPRNCDSFVNPLLRTSFCFSEFPPEELIEADLRYVLCRIAGKEVMYVEGDEIKRDKLCNVIMRFVRVEAEDGKAKVFFDDEKWRKFVEESGLMAKVQAERVLKKALGMLKKRYD